MLKNACVPVFVQYNASVELECKSDWCAAQVCFNFPRCLLVVSLTLFLIVFSEKTTTLDRVIHLPSAYRSRLVGLSAIVRKSTSYCTITVYYHIIVVSHCQILFLNTCRRRLKGSGPLTICEWCSVFSISGWLLIDPFTSLHSFVLSRD